MARLVAAAFICLLAACATTPVASPAAARPDAPTPRSLGNFSVSLAVKDLGASRAFYEKLGFRMVGGDPLQNWVILQNDTATVGLFQGMFDRNVLTFNPGWDRSGATLTDFEDVRDLQRMLRDRGLTPAPGADESTPGPASFMVVDPDGNPILVDQHVPRPSR
jgi:catechol 2,3-dioxygenase-like lactoylglutathione lyase family enzyme